jgi:hypothetical protein
MSTRREGMTDLAGRFWTKLCEKMSLERSFGDAEEEVQGRADRRAAASDRTVDVAGEGGVLRRRHFPAELLELDQARRMKRERMSTSSVWSPICRLRSRYSRRCVGQPVSPERRRKAVEGIRGKYGLSATCLPDLCQPRATPRYTTIVQADEYPPIGAIVSCIPIRTICLSPDPSPLVDAGW